MPDMTLTRPGQTNGDGATDELFLKQYGGEVMTAFEERNIMKDLHLIKTITSGKVKSFPATWKTSAAYHTPGNRVVGAQTVLRNERLVYIDDVLLSDIFVAELDELREDYDSRSIYTEQQGSALARAFDQKSMSVAVIAARTAATVTGAYGGSIVTAANALVDEDELIAAWKAAAQALDEKDIPAEDRHGILRPAQYMLVLESDKVVKDQYDVGGSIRNAKWSGLWDIAVHKSNNVPRTDLHATTSASENNSYYADFSVTVCPIFHKSAIGTLKRMDLTVQKTSDDGDFAVEYQGVLLVAKYNMGHGVLRPEAAVEVRTGTPTPN